MGRGGDAGRKPVDAVDDAAARREYDLQQVDETTIVACTAAIEFLRACAATHGSNPPSLEARATSARAAMSAIGQHWQALVRASEK